MFKHQHHEDHAAAFEVRNKRGQVIGAAGTLAIPAAYATFLAVYRKQHGKVCDPLYFLERRDARTGQWLPAERSLSKVTFQQALNVVRTSRGALRLRVRDYKGTAYTVRNDGSFVHDEGGDWRKECDVQGLRQRLEMEIASHESVLAALHRDHWFNAEERRRAIARHERELTILRARVSVLSEA